MPRGIKFYTIGTKGCFFTGNVVKCPFGQRRIWDIGNELHTSVPDARWVECVLHWVAGRCPVGTHSTWTTQIENVCGNMLDRGNKATTKYRCVEVVYRPTAVWHFAPEALMNLLANVSRWPAPSNGAACGM